MKSIAPVLIALFIALLAITPVYAQTATPSSDSTAYDLIPKGTSDSVEIVSQGSLINSSVPVVVRNNTSDAVTITNVVGTARGADGTLLDSASLADIAPKNVPSGEVAFGQVIFSEPNIPVDATIELQLEWEVSGSGWIDYEDLEIVEIEANTNGFVGTLVNNTDKDLEFVTVVGVTLDENGVPVGYYSGYVSASIVPSGKTATFDGYLQGVPSDVYLVAAYAIVF